MSELSTIIETAAEQPASVTTDAGSATARSLPDLIAADNHLSAEEAVSGTNLNGGPKSAWGCLRPARVVPPGSV